MKRRQLLRYLKSNDCQLYREGKRHTVYVNPKNGKASTIPRHTEIKDTLVRKICKDLTFLSRRLSIESRDGIGEFSYWHHTRLSY